VKVLLSAFEPFGDKTENASELLINLLNVTEAQKVVLPVDYQEAFSCLQASVLDVEPDVVLALGEAAARERLCFEWYALNVQSAKLTDNQGVLFLDQAIYEDSPASLQSSWNFSELKAVLARREEIELSYHAGTYVCNRLFYELLSKETQLGVKTAFIHVPTFDKAGSDRLSLEAAAGALQKFIDHLMEDPKCLYSV